MFSKRQVQRAVTIHAMSLSQAKTAAIAAGWHAETVNQVANLDYTQKGLESLVGSSGVTKTQASRLRGVREAAKMEMVGNFTLSQII